MRQARRNPVGVEILLAPLTRGSSLRSQPRAMRRNSFGVKTGCVHRGRVIHREQATTHFGLDCGACQRGAGLSATPVECCAARVDQGIRNSLSLRHRTDLTDREPDLSFGCWGQPTNATERRIDGDGHHNLMQTPYSTRFRKGPGVRTRQGGAGSFEGTLPRFSFSLLRAF